MLIKSKQRIQYFKNSNTKFLNLNTKLYTHQLLKIQKNHFQEPQMDDSNLQEKMIQQQYDSIIAEKQDESKRNELTYINVSIWNDANYKPTKIVQTNRHSFNIYADKLLIHLVLQVKFDFYKIAEIMSYTFIQQPNHYTEQTCRQRWHEIHRDRNFRPQIKHKEMEDKRVKSIMSMTDPFLLYNIEQKLHKMQTQENQEVSFPKQLEYKYEGYSIFKDSIRRIDDMQKYNELQKHMRQALGKASIQVQLEKPMLYTPYYDRLEHFQVLQEELTLQKMQQMMSHPIQMELMERQLKVLDLNQRNFQSKIKKQVEKKVKQQKIRNQQQFQIEQDWDEYESD